MAIAFAQNLGNLNTASATSLAGTFGSSTVSGNLIATGARIGATGRTVTGSDSKTNTYSQAKNQVQTTDGHEIFAHYAPNITGGASHQTTISISGAAASIRMTLHEYSGLATSTPVDQTSGNQGSAATLDSGAATTTQADELIFGVGSNASGFTFTAGTSFLNLVASPSGATAKQAGEDRIVAATGSYSASFTIPSGDNWACLMVTFKGAGGGSTKPLTVATINATSAMSASVAKFAKITGTANATSNVTANVAKIALVKPGTINSTSTVSARVNKLAAIAATINATSPVNATLSKLGQKQIVPASISATSTVSAALQRLAGISASMTATSFLTILGQLVQALLNIELDRVSREAGLGLGSMYEYSGYTMATSAERAEHARVNAGVGLGAGSHIDFTNAAAKTDEATTEGNRVKDLAGIGGGSQANL